MQTSEHKIRLLVAESVDLVRIGLHSLFENHESIQLVGVADSVEALYMLAPQSKPDVVLLDFLLYGNDFIDQIAKFMNILPLSKILVLTHQNSAHTDLQAFRAGAMGIFNKNNPTELLIKAIHAIHVGQIWFDRNVTKLLWKSQFDNDLSMEMPQNSKGTCSLDLSDNERRIAQLSSQGLSAKQISTLLSISEKTARNKLSLIYKRLGVKKQIELCITWV